MLFTHFKLENDIKLRYLLISCHKTTKTDTIRKRKFALKQCYLRILCLKMTLNCDIFKGHAWKQLKTTLSQKTSCLKKELSTYFMLQNDIKLWSFLISCLKTTKEDILSERKKLPYKKDMYESYTSKSQEQDIFANSMPENH